MGKLTDLPLELSIRIAQHLSTQDAINLACTRRALLDIGEARSWRDLRVNTDESTNHLRTIAAFDEAWYEFGAAVARRPTRRSYISRLRCRLTPQSAPLLLDLFSPPSSITYLEINRMFLYSFQETSRSSFPGMKTLARAPGLDSLTHFTIADRTAPEIEVYACLANMPNLVLLDLSLGKPKDDDDGQAGTLADMKNDTSWDDHHTGDKDIAVSSRMRLPKLKRLFFRSHMWLDPLVGILDQAPIVDYLYVECGHPEVSHKDPDVEKDRNRCKMAMRVLGSSTIRSFNADDGIVQLIYGYASVPLTTDWMPNMTRLSCWGPPLKGRFPAHDRLEDLIFWDYGPPDSNDLLGTFPSSTITGLIAPWIIELLVSLPSLTRLEVRIDEGPGYEPEHAYGQSDPAAGGFRFMVFSDDHGEDLHHARVVEVTEVEGWLLAHHHRSKGAVDLSWNLAVHCGDDDDINPDGVTVLESPDPDADDMDDPLELSSYRGRPLPKSLLLWVYQECGVEWAWTEGARGIALPEHVWQYLMEWHDEVASAQG